MPNFLSLTYWLLCLNLVTNLPCLSQTGFNFTEEDLVFNNSDIFYFNGSDTITKTDTNTDTKTDTGTNVDTGTECGSNVHQCIVTDYWFTDYSCNDWPSIGGKQQYGNITVTQDDFSKSNKWRSVMWFNDDIWENTLSDYQKILQQSFTYAAIDLHNKWGGSDNFTNYDIDELTTDDLYVNVTFFLGFCLLADQECDIITEDDLTELESDGDIVGDRGEGTYYVYSVLYSTDEKTKYVHSLLETFSYDYMAYASMRMQCDNFSTVLPGVDTSEVAFEGWAFYVTPLKVLTPWEVPEILNWSVAGFVGFCVLFAIAGAIHGFGIWGADCIRVSGIIYFGLYTWDFYSDIVFTLSLWDSYRLGDTDVILFYAAAAFVVIPWFANMMALSRYQNKWCKDETIRERVYQWFVSWQRLTYALAALSGSAFGTVELANSYVFGLDFFCMGLNERHLKKFNNNRLYSSILVENAPQICIQIIYLTQVVKEFSDIWDEEIALAALAASTLSVGAACLDIYASKKLFSVLKKDGQYVGKTSCCIFVISSEIKQEATRLQISTYAFRDAIAETLSTHPRSVEMHFPIATATGFKMKFTIFSSKLTPEVIYKAIKQGAESKLPKRIQTVWRLRNTVVIPTDRIEVERMEAENENGEGMQAPLNSMKMSSGNLEGNNIELPQTNDANEMALASTSNLNNTNDVINENENGNENDLENQSPRARKKQKQKEKEKEKKDDFLSDFRDARRKPAKGEY